MADQQRCSNGHYKDWLVSIHQRPSHWKKPCWLQRKYHFNESQIVNKDKRPGRFQKNQLLDVSIIDR